MNDYIVFCVVVLLGVLALNIQVTADNGSRAELVDSPVTASGDHEESALTADAPAKQEFVCIDRVDGLLQGRYCRQPALDAADPLVRRIRGQPVCWWTATREDLQGIRGVGRSTAAALARYRNLGGLPVPSMLTSIHRIGEKTSVKIASALTTDCARHL